MKCGNKAKRIRRKSPLPASPRGGGWGMLLRLVTQPWRIRPVRLIGLIRPNKPNELNAPDNPLIIRWLPKGRLLACKTWPFAVRLTAFCKAKGRQSHSACSAHPAHQSNKPDGPDGPDEPDNHAVKVQGFAFGRRVFADGKGFCGLIYVHFLQMATFLLTC